MIPYIGCAGWSVRSRSTDHFGADGTHLQRYSRQFQAVEINSSFYRPHQTKTYARWADSTPAGFRFSVKLPKVITHELRLKTTEEVLNRFQSEVAGLGAKLGPILVQLPPSLRFELPVVNEFFNQLRNRFEGAVVCEPRHASWFSVEPENLMADFKISRVAADPPPAPSAASPAGSRDVVYFRLHGSPRMYYSFYGEQFLASLTTKIHQLGEQSIEVWCIFDNTAAGAAVENALELQQRIRLAPQDEGTIMELKAEVT